MENPGVYGCHVKFSSERDDIRLGLDVLFYHGPQKGLTFRSTVLENGRERTVPLHGMQEFYHKFCGLLGYTCRCNIQFYVSF